MKNKFYIVLAAFVLYSIGMNAQKKLSERLDSVRINQYGQEVNWLSLNPEVQDGILNFTSEDGSYHFWMDNRVQLDAAIFSNAKTALLSPAILAGSFFGPITTKSLCITPYRRVPKPSAINFSSLAFA